MNTEKMNIHRALAELKVIDARISKALRDGGPYALANKHSNDKIAGEPISKYAEKVESAFDSVCDLYERRAAMKRAVVQSNAVTKVMIAGKEYTVAEAIEMKNHGIPLRQGILNTLTRDYLAAKSECDRNNGDILERRADDHVKNMFGSSDMKNATEEVKRAREEFISQQKFELVDPLDLNTIIKSLEKEIHDFSVEVDAALSVSNAITEIEFSYGKE